jgi:hypothetical protein
MVLRGESRTHRILRSRLTLLLGATLVLDAVGTILMYLLEHDHRSSGFHSLGGALFWVSAQLTTVSSRCPIRSRQLAASLLRSSARGTSNTSRPLERRG